jgi:hypothetical protein
VSQHAPRPGSGLADDCEDLYAIAANGSPVDVALASGPGAGLEAAEDLSRAIVNRGDDFI